MACASPGPDKSCIKALFAAHGADGRARRARRARQRRDDTLWPAGPRLKLSSLLGIIIPARTAHLGEGSRFSIPQKAFSHAIFVTPALTYDASAGVMRRMIPRYFTRSRLKHCCDLMFECAMAGLPTAEMCELMMIIIEAFYRRACQCALSPPVLPPSHHRAGGRASSTPAQSARGFSAILRGRFPLYEGFIYLICGDFTGYGSTFVLAPADNV